MTVYPVDPEESRADLINKYINRRPDQDSSQIGSYITREKEISSFDWKILQFSNDNAYKDAVNSTTVYWIIVTVICLFLAFLLAWVLSFTLNNSITSMTSMMINASSTNFYIDPEQIYLNEFRRLCVAINNMNTRINSLMQENIKKEREKVSLEIDALGSKINSHFLYNTLNLVKMMAIKEGQMDIAKIIVSLSEILQYSYKDSTFMVPLFKEIEFTNNYTYIQTVRFHKNIDIDYEIDGTVSSITVPKMILQPIVENSILHAFENSESDNQILISAQYSSKDKKKLEIYIEDNGIGFDYQGLDHLTGIGLKNVIQRLKLYYGDELSYKIDSKINQGTSVTLIFPVSKN